MRCDAGPSHGEVGPRACECSVVDLAPNPRVGPSSRETGERLGSPRVRRGRGARPGRSRTG